MALLDLVKQRADLVFQPSPLAAQNRLETFDGRDPQNPTLFLPNPRAMADRLQHLYISAKDVGASLKLESDYALSFIAVLNSAFSQLGAQVVHSLCHTDLQRRYRV